jgi:hypothetical protein
MARTPARRTPRPRTDGQPVTPGSPVEIRLIGHQTDVHRLITAMQASASGSTGAVSYRPSRYAAGAVRAYLTVVIPAVEEQL